MYLGLLLFFFSALTLHQSADLFVLFIIVRGIYSELIYWITIATNAEIIKQVAHLCKHSKIY